MKCPLIKTRAPGIASVAAKCPENALWQGWGKTEFSITTRYKYSFRTPRLMTWVRFPSPARISKRYPDDSIGIEPMSNRQPGFDESSGRTIRDAQRVRVPWMARVFPISRSTLSRQTASIAPVRSPRHTPQTSPVLSPDRPPTRSCLIARCTFRPAGSTWGTLSTLLIHGRRTACRDVWKKTGQDHPFRIGETGNARDGPLAPKTPFETG